MNVMKLYDKKRNCKRQYVTVALSGHKLRCPHEGRVNEYLYIQFTLW